MKSPDKLHKGQSHPNLYICNPCQKPFSTKGSLKIHKRSIHEKVKFPCNVCYYQASRPEDLKTHTESVHEGIKYPCISCDFRASSKGVLMAFLLVIVYKAMSPASNSAHDQFTIKTSVKQLSFLSTPQIAFSSPFKAFLHLEH